MAASGTGNTRLYLGGLPFRATEDDVRDFFGGCGAIASVEIRLGPDGRPAGFGFLTFRDAESVPKALALDGSDMMGRWLRVQVAAQQRRSVKPEGCKRVFVGNLPYDIRESEVREFFAGCGEIVEVYFLWDREARRNKGICFVTFEETEAADRAVALAGSDLEGRPIKIDFATPPRQGTT